MSETIPIADLRAGDTLVAVDGHQLNRPIIVTDVMGLTADQTLQVQVEQPATSRISPNRFLRYSEVTVKRPAKPRRQARRTFDGITFIRQEDGSWRTEDGRWEVAYDDTFETECMEPHPMKISAAMRRSWADASEWDRNHRWGPPELVWALREGKKGYLCPGDQIHFYGLWVAGSVDDADVVNREYTFTSSAAHLAQFIQGKAERTA